jgi:hypothetical protein
MDDGKMLKLLKKTLIVVITVVIFGIIGYVSLNWYFSSFDKMIGR